RKVPGRISFAGSDKLESAMDSKLALQQKQAQFRALQRLTPQQRLNAFLVHCRLVTSLHHAGAVRRGDTRREG
ncbi:MAG: hypothetical protein OEW72_01850, partial [Gammaproteobacteria bacterium]|nr:hypothetical protein [Gammaproteobacteria bacterium]